MTAGSLTGTTILVPVDFQDASLVALATARDLGKRLGFEVVLLHTYMIPVITYPGFDPIVAPDMSQEIANASNNALEKLATEQGGLRTILLVGDAAAKILETIEEHKPALVVMGTHGRSGLSHLLLGSVTEKVIRASTVPVLTVRTPPASH